METIVTQTSPINLSQVKEFIQEKVPFFKKVGVKVNSISHGKIKLSIPFDALNLNHFGTYQAGVYFTLAEASGAALLATVFDLTQVLLLTKECNVNFIQPARKYLSFQGTLEQLEIEELWEQLEQTRKANITLNVKLLNEDEKLSAEASVVYYLRKDLALFLKRQGGQQC